MKRRAIRKKKKVAKIQNDTLLAKNFHSIVKLDESFQKGGKTMKRGVVIVNSSDTMATRIARSSGCRVYVRRLSMDEDICLFEGDSIAVLLTKLRLIMAEFENFHERRKRKRARVR